MPQCPWCQAVVLQPKYPCPKCGKRASSYFNRVSQPPVSGGSGPRSKVPVSAEENHPRSRRPDMRAEREEEVELSPLDRSDAPSPFLPDLELDVPSAPGVPDLAPDLDFARPASPAPSPPAAEPEEEKDKIPSLLPPPKPQAPAVSARPPAAAPPAPLPVQGLQPTTRQAGGGFGAFDDPGEGASGGALELDLGGAAPVALPAPVPSAPPGVPSARPPATSSESPRSLAPAPVQGDAEQLADYGPAPEKWWQAPAYAYRVKMRQVELKRHLASRKEELGKAKEKEDDAFVAFAERGRSAAVGKESYARLLAAVAQAEATLRERDGALAAARDAHARLLAQVDERLGAAEREVLAALAEERRAADQLAQAEDVRQRAEAKVKRIEIEARISGRRSGAELAPASAEEQARAAERAARVAEYDATMPAVTRATQLAAEARRKVAVLSQKVILAKNERAELEEQFRRRGATQGAQVTEAQKGVRDAMVALGREAAKDGATFGADYAGARADLAALMRATETSDRDVTLYAAACEAYDKGGVTRGLIVAVMAVVLLFAAVVIPLALHKPPPKPPPVDLAE